MSAATPKTVDAYFAGVPSNMRAPLENLRATIKEAVLQAEEVISYQMLAFRQNGRLLLCYAAFKDHCSLFAASYEVRRRFAKELKPFAAGKGTLRFTPERPIPASLVKRIVKMRVAENEARARARAGRGTGGRGKKRSRKHPDSG